MHTTEDAKRIVRDAYKSYDPNDPSQEFSVILDSRRGKSARIEIPLNSIQQYRVCLTQIIVECQRQLEDSSPANMKRRHPGIALGGYQEIWRKYVRSWKRRG